MSPRTILFRAQPRRPVRSPLTDATLRQSLEALRATDPPAQGLRRTLTALGLNPDAQLRRTEHRAIAVSGRAAGVIAVALMVLGLCWFTWLERDPVFVAPAAEAHEPNAFKNFTAAAAAYRTVADRHRQDDMSVETPEKALTMPLVRKKRIVAAYSLPLRLLREGFRYEYTEPPVRSFNQTSPHYAGYRGLARVLAIEGQVLEEEGNLSGANAADLDAMDLGVRIQNGATVIGRLVGNACSAMGRPGIWRRLNRLSASECRAALKRLSDIEKRRVPLDATLSTEMVATATSLQDLMRQPGWRFRLVDLLGGDPTQSDRWYYVLRSLATSKTDMINMYLTAMTRERERATAYPDRFLPRTSRAADSPLVAPLVLETRELVVKDAADQAQNALLIASLAIRAYKLEKGQWPRNIGDLVRFGYLRAAPTDPFAPPGTPVRFVYQSGRPIPYSIGPDLRDNGGTTIYKVESGGKKPSVYVQSDSIGDIVAGMNAQ